MTEFLLYQLISYQLLLALYPEILSSCIPRIVSITPAQPSEYRRLGGSKRRIEVLNQDLQSVDSNRFYLRHSCSIGLLLMRRSDEIFPALPCNVFDNPPYIQSHSTPPEGKHSSSFIFERKGGEEQPSESFHPTLKSVYPM